VPNNSLKIDSLISLAQDELDKLSNDRCYLGSKYNINVEVYFYLAINDLLGFDVMDHDDWSSVLINSNNTERYRFSIGRLKSMKQSAVQAI